LEDRCVPIAVQSFTGTALNPLVDKLLQGTGVTISNVSFQGNILAAGTFTNGTNTVGLSSGIVLDTGFLSNIPGVYRGNTPLGNGRGVPGTPLFAPVDPLNTDAEILTFNIVSQGPQIPLRFVFASNEFIQNKDLPFVQPPFPPGTIPVSTNVRADDVFSAF